MLIRHMTWKEKYPDKPKARGIPFTGIENARPETIAIGGNFEELRAELPFDPLDFIKFNMPDEIRVTSRVDAVDWIAHFPKQLPGNSQFPGKILES